MNRATAAVARRRTLTTAPGADRVVTANVSKTFATTANDTLIKLDAWIKLDAESTRRLSAAARSS